MWPFIKCFMYMNRVEYYTAVENAIFILIWSNIQDAISNGGKSERCIYVAIFIKMEKEYIYSVFVSIKNQKHRN